MHTFSSYFPPPTECSLKISLSVLRIRLKFWFLTPDSFKTQQFQAFDVALIFIHQPVLHILNGQEKLRCSLSQTTNADTSIFWLWANCTTYFYTNIFSRQDFLMFCSFSNLRWWRVIRVSSFSRTSPIFSCSILLDGIGTLNCARLPLLILCRVPPARQVFTASKYACDDRYCNKNRVLVTALGRTIVQSTAVIIFVPRFGIIHALPAGSGNREINISPG